MRDNRVRHLPVVDGGRVVGVLSQRDILIMESLPGVNPTEVRVEEAMVRDVFTVGPEAPVGEVIETMIDRKLGSTIVCEGEQRARCVHDHRRPARAARACSSAADRGRRQRQKCSSTQG